MNQNYLSKKQKQRQHQPNQSINLEQNNSYTNISNKQKISQLHQRIKLLDKLQQKQDNEIQRRLFNKSSTKLINSQQQNSAQFYQQRHSKLRTQIQSGKGIQNKNTNSFKSVKQIREPSPQQLNVRNIYSPKHQNGNTHVQYQNTHVQYQNTPYQRLNNANDIFPLQAKYLTIQDKFLKFKLSEEQLIKNIQTQIGQLNQASKGLKKDLQKVHQKSQQSLEQTQRYLSQQIGELYQQLKDIKKGAIESIDNKYKAIKCQTISLISDQFQSLTKSSQTQLTSQINSIQSLFLKQQQIRDQTAQFLINSFGDQIIKLQQVLSHERETRLQKNDQLIRQIEHVEDKLMERNARERIDMRDGIDAMERMLEQVCYRIEERILGDQ